jgi:hypothetical protein
MTENHDEEQSLSDAHRAALAIARENPTQHVPRHVTTCQIRAPV